MLESFNCVEGHSRSFITMTYESCDDQHIFNVHFIDAEDPGIGLAEEGNGRYDQADSYRGITERISIRRVHKIRLKARRRWNGGPVQSGLLLRWCEQLELLAQVGYLLLHERTNGD